MNQAIESLIELNKLEKSYIVGKNHIIKAVDQVSFSIAKGEIFGLIGESGSGKSTIGKCLVGIENPDGGTIQYKGRKIQIIFQDPLVSMNPRMNILKIMEEPIKLSKRYRSKSEARIKILELLGQVGIQENILKRYPSELSGGQNQRVCIARALACEPEVIVADEPTASLDVTIRGQIMELFQSLQKEKGLTILLITHDLILARRICDKIGIMNHGKLLELGKAEEVCSNPLHAYTKSLISAIPAADPLSKNKRILYKEEPSFDMIWKEESKGHYLLTK